MIFNFTYNRESVALCFTDVKVSKTKTVSMVILFPVLILSLHEYSCTGK